MLWTPGRSCLVHTQNSRSQKLWTFQREKIASFQRAAYALFCFDLGLQYLRSRDFLTSRRVRYKLDMWFIARRGISTLFCFTIDTVACLAAWIFKPIVIPCCVFVILCYPQGWAVNEQICKPPQILLDNAPATTPNTKSRHSTDRPTPLARDNQSSENQYWVGSSMPSILRPLQRSPSNK